MRNTYNYDCVDFCKTPLRRTLYTLSKALVTVGLLVVGVSCGGGSNELESALTDACRRSGGLSGTEEECSEWAKCLTPTLKEHLSKEEQARTIDRPLDDLDHLIASPQVREIVRQASWKCMADAGL